MTPEQRALKMIFGDHEWPYFALDDKFIHPEKDSHITVRELTAQYAAEDAAQ